MSFFKAADYLDVQSLLRPAAAFWVDEIIKRTLDPATRIEEFINEGRLSKDQAQYFKDYILGLKTPRTLSRDQLLKLQSFCLKLLLCIR